MCFTEAKAKGHDNFFPTHITDGVNFSVNYRKHQERELNA